MDVAHAMVSNTLRETIDWGITYKVLSDILSKIFFILVPFTFMLGPCNLVIRVYHDDYKVITSIIVDTVYWIFDFSFLETVVLFGS